MAAAACSAFFSSPGRLSLHPIAAAQLHPTSPE